MARRGRINAGGYVYHVMNRITFNRVLLVGSGDCGAFVEAMRDASEYVPMRMLAYCLLLRHWHLVLWPFEDGDLSRFMHRLTMTHSQRWNAAHESIGDGHLYQGRYRSFPVQPDGHVAMVCRYVEANSVRSGNVTSPEEWRWSSAAYRREATHEVELPLVPLQAAVPEGADAEAALTEGDLAQIRECIKRGRPYGDPIWQTETARRLGAEYTLRARGRPRKG